MFEKDMYNSVALDDRKHQPKPPPNYKPKPPRPDQRLLELLTEAIKSEQRDLKLYDLIHERLTRREDKELLRMVKMNTLKNIKLLEQIYQSIVGKPYGIMDMQSAQVYDAPPNEMLAKAMFDKLDNVTMYRKLYFAFLNPDIRDMIFEIICDNQCDAIKIQYCLSCVVK